MKKSLVNSMFISLLIFGLFGCSDESPQPKLDSNKKITEAQLGKGIILGYAHMQNGDQLISIDHNITEKPNTETVLITTKGFYPNYNLYNSNSHECGRFRLNERGESIDDSKTAFCSSHYVEQHTSSMVGNAVEDSIFGTITSAIGSLSTGKINPVYSITKFFNKNKFLRIMDKNKLPYFRKKLLKLHKIANDKKVLTNQIYKKYLEKYTQNVNNIKFIYNIQDESKLLPLKILSGDYQIVLNPPYKKVYSFTSIVDSFSATPTDFDSKYLSAINKINNQFKEYKKEYEAYLTAGFNNYKLEGPREKIFKYNDHISFNSTIKAPLDIKYNPGKKIKIPIIIVVKSAILKNMFPKYFSLIDSNMKIVFRVNPNITVSTIAENKTTSFVTIKSLTSYYNNDVYNKSNINREISPESATLPENSTYLLLSNEEMKNSSIFRNITKKNISKFKIRYGYAAKYHINNTNIDRSMYNTKKYSLYSIFKQYL